jgi:hypothetical protein
VECHGQINDMVEVYHAKPLSMTYCLDCHRNPAMRLRPLDKITDLDWKPTDDLTALATVQLEKGTKIVRDWKVQSLQNCSTCHR